MHVVEHFHLAPGCCAFCRSERHLPAVDIGKDLDAMHYEGRAYVCEACGIEIGALLGMVPSDAADKQAKATSEAELRANAAENRANAAERAVAALTELAATPPAKKVPAKKSPAKKKVSA